MYDHGVLLFDILGGGQHFVSGERAKVLARQIGVSEKVIDETADEVCGFNSASMVGFNDFQMLYFEIFSRVQPEPQPCQTNTKQQQPDLDLNELQQTDYDQKSERDESNLI